MRVFTKLVAGAFAFAAHAALACPSCYGQNASGPMVDGMNAGILSMLGIVGTVLTAIAFFFVMMRRRSRRLFDTSPGNAFLNEQGNIQWKNF